MKRVSVVCIAIAAAIAGCRVDQNKEVAEYRKVIDLPGTTPATAPATRPADEPLTLLDAILLTNQNNEKLAIQGETYLQAIINEKRAIAQFIPTANLIGTYGLAGDSAIHQSESNYRLAAVGQVNVFNGFRDVEGLKIAELTIEQQRYLLLSLQSSLILNTIQAYYSVLQLEAQSRVLEQSLVVQEEGLRNVRGRFNAGLARTLDVAQTEAQMSATRVQLLNARTQTVNARSALAILTGLPNVDMPMVEVRLPQSSYTNLEEAQQLALKSREDLLAAEKSRQAFRQQVEVAFGQYYPSLNANLAYNMEKMTIPAERNWETLFTLNLPIFSAGKINADVRQAWSQFRQAVWYQSLLHRQILQDVKIAFNDYYASQQHIIELEKQVDAARLAQTQAEQSYGVGLATNLERLAAVQQYLSAELDLTSERYNQQVYAAELSESIQQLRPAVEKAIAARSATTRATTAPTTQPVATRSYPTGVSKTPLD